MGDERMRKIWLFVFILFLFPNCVKALSLECPSVASAGEEIRCIVRENELIGIKANYKVDSAFSYVDFQDSSWKDYYHDSLGFSVGNVLDESDFEGIITFKVGMNVVSGQEYQIRLVGVEGTTSNYQYQKVEDLTSHVKIVSDVNTLDNLEVLGGTLDPKFDKNVTSYQVVLDKSSTNIQATATDANALVEGDIGEVSLQYGMNVFTIKVTSTRGTVREYQIYITRPFSKSEVGKSGDATLASLTISNGKIEFKKDVYLYQISVDNKIKNVDVKAIPNSNSSRVEIKQPEELVVGDNKIEVIVTAEDGTKLIYVIMVHREKELSHDNQLKNLRIKGYSISFDPDVYQYDLEIQDEDRLEILVELSDSNASYQIKGNNNLKDGSIITIEVKAEDGSKKNYQIHILKYHDVLTSSITNYIKIVPLILFILLISIILIIKVLRRKISSNK